MRKKLNLRIVDAAVRVGVAPEDAPDWFSYADDWSVLFDGEDTVFGTSGVVFASEIGKKEGVFEVIGSFIFIPTMDLTEELVARKGLRK